MSTPVENKQEYPVFATHPNLDDRVKKSIEKLGFERMTEVQAKTFDPSFAGLDVLGRARTGSGKTMAFLLPALSRLLNSSNENSNSDVRMLILSPTRELTQQIAEQCGLITKSLPRNFTHQVMVGGTSKPKDISIFGKSSPSILIVTPGRLQDHLENTSIRGRPFAAFVQNLDILVLDEMDRLLDMGFRRDIERILSYLPDKNSRQTLLFSATIPNDVKAIIKQTLREGYTTVDCIHDKDAAESHATNAQVTQAHVIVPAECAVASIIAMLQSILKNQGSKLVVFFPTANLVAFYAAVFNKYLSSPVLEIHSRKSQSAREKASEQFRKNKAHCLFTSDVSARGVDYPDVTHVIQLGIADSRESYIHRLGRTGRAGKAGQGVLVLTDVEQGFLRMHLKDLDIPVHQELQGVADGAATNVESIAELQLISEAIRNQTDGDLHTKAVRAYISVLGFYNTHLKARCGVPGADRLVDFSNTFARQIGFVDELPPIEKKTIGKMGLKGVQGLNIGPPNGGGRNDNRNNGGGRGRGGGGLGGLQKFNGGGRGRGGNDNNGLPPNNNERTASPYNDSNNNNDSNDGRGARGGRGRGRGRRRGGRGDGGGSKRQSPTHNGEPNKRRRSRNQQD